MGISSSKPSGPVVRAAPQDDLMDLLGDGPVLPRPALSQPVLGSLLKPVSGAIGSGISQAGLPASMQAEVATSVAEWSLTKVQGDAVLDISTAKVHKHDELAILICISNNSAQPLAGVEVQLDPPRNFKTSYVGEPQPMVQGNRLSVNVPGRSRAFICVKLGLLDIVPSMALRGQVAYKGEGGVMTLSFQNVIEVADLLRPVPLSTEEFGQHWSKCGDGKRVNITNSSVKTTATYTSRVKNTLCINPVQVIGNEIISAGQLMGAGGLLVLVHARLDIAKGGVDITVNSPQAQIAELVARSCIVIFK